MKSHKIVKFPFQNFDPTDYLAQVPRETILKAQMRKKRIKSEKSQTDSEQTIEHNHVDHSDKSLRMDHNDNCAPMVEELSNQNDQSVPSQNKMDSNLFSNSCDHIPNCNGIDSNSDSLDMDVDMFPDLKDFHQHRLSSSDSLSLKYRLYALAVSFFFFFSRPLKYLFSNNNILSVIVWKTSFGL